MKLFLLSYAGGSASIYNKYFKYLNHTENITIELPGHLLCLDRPLLCDYTAAVYEVVKQIKKSLSGDEKYIVYGHSLGAILAYHASCQLVDELYPVPSYLFLSGSLAPNQKRVFEKPVSKMDDHEFLNMIEKYGGTPKEFINSKELLELYLPILRADFKVVETYTNSFSRILDSKAYIINGVSDKKVIDTEKEWKLYFSKQVEIIHYEGDHFFINQHLPDIFCKITNLLECVEGDSYAL